eukprot:TRINITY_DN259_c0_g1_i10.p1 TRINITY_DN259_c0_g1~~TRINITY_DN259_c0_g1_i10.p1  ORF type:complete len:214 (+),score=78.83 TRINITY_DN259_c0_g1_i10:620-1261(+)
MGPSAKPFYINGSHANFTGLIVKSNIAFSSASDRRLKKDVTTMGNILPSVNKLRSVRFKFKSDEKENVHIGYIAQELEEIFPELVHGRESEETMRSVAYGPTGVIALGAVKELLNEYKAFKQTSETSYADLESVMKKYESLYEELKAADETTSSEIAELKASNEELKASNEELKAADETKSSEIAELKASNEELKASHEELKARFEALLQKLS